MEFFPGECEIWHQDEVGGFLERRSGGGAESLARQAAIDRLGLAGSVRFTLNFRLVKILPATSESPRASLAPYSPSSCFCLRPSPPLSLDFPLPLASFFSSPRPSLEPARQQNKEPNRPPVSCLHCAVESILGLYLARLA